MSEEDQPRMTTSAEHIADLTATHAALGAVIAVLVKVEHALGAGDARVRDAALKEVGARLKVAIDATESLAEHITVAELMADMDDGELEVLRKRLGATDEEEE